MMEDLRNGYEDARSRVQGMTMGDPPDGENEGVGQIEGLIALGVATGAGLLARQMLQGGWRMALDREPPKNPSSHEVDWRDALLWGAVSGAVVGLVRIASRRGTSAAYNQWRR
ncbi:DUF4235 domain-containing protein [Roseimaritima ulvae]|uniref:DUF4235 domain-containing protein n=1 Tax=Roseimaritima ulvae TaxID=980254 RepID=A0A5B9QST6_9BACT|nr:DUF4235 domain-containing protein [Roseimaritima ulvae]QEG40942.1 hypothetical protein UC8_29600 [Roseimaritima ulvae]